MKLEVLDNQRSENNSSLFVTIGVFTLLMILGMSYLFNILCLDFLININVDKTILFFLMEILNLLVSVFLALYVSKSIRTRQEEGIASLKNILRNIIGLYILSQILQALYAYYRMDIWSIEVLEQLGAYYSYIEEIHYREIISVIFEALKYFFIGFVFIKK
jgi:hypothetical protein